MRSKPLKSTFFAAPTLEVAPALVGVVMEYGGCRGRIVEVEAYTTDPASHAFRRTERSAIMYDTYGRIYVYFIYGAYHCINFTTDANGVGAVLIRAVEPLDGIELMRKRRGVEDVRKLCNGPGKLCDAFGIDLELNGQKVGESLKLYEGTAGSVRSSQRIGITKAVDLHWRFTEEGSAFLSRGK